MSDTYESPEDELTAETTDDAVIGQALKWSAVAVVVIGCLVAGIVWWVKRPRDTSEVVEEKVKPPEQERVSSQVVIPRIPFRDVTSAAGIRFVQNNGATGEKLLPETMCGGGGFFDFDNDGDQDILCINAQAWPWDRGNKPATSTAALFANDGSGKFTDVTANSGLDVPIYGMGCAFGDYDADGLVDVFISALGSNRLFHNDGNGKFSDVTESTGVAGAADRWSSSCGFFDCDRDGDLDLLVCNYLEWSREFDLSQNFTLDGTHRKYGEPKAFPGTQAYLYRNDGNGKFSDISQAAGIEIVSPATGQPMAKSLGLCFHDVNADGLTDFLIANDTVQNMLFINRGEGRFEESAVAANCAFDQSGDARGAMGIDSGDFRNDGSMGFVIGNFATEMTALYCAEIGDPPFFADDAVSNGIGPVTRQVLTFGVLFLDADLDGRLDIFAANGHLEEDINKVQSSQHYEQPPQLLWNRGDHGEEFVELTSEQCTPDFTKPMVGRGAACADIDSDGDLDILVFAAGQAPRLLRNDQATGHNWLRVKLTDQSPNIHALGATVVVTLNDGRTLRRTVSPTRSYQSQVELPVSFGLGKATIETISVTWPDGTEQVVPPPDPNQTIQVGKTP